MSDERTDNGMQPGGGFDDDRLLAFALGLDDDPELLAAAENDAELSGRLAAMRADVARIGAQVAAAVPAPADAYTDLSGERWSGLKEYFEAPASAAKPRRERRWWRVVAPVTALAVLALAVGIVAVNRGSSSSTSGSSAEVARSSSEAAQPGAADDLGTDAGTDKTTGTDAGTGVVTTTEPAPTTAMEPAPTTAVERLADQLDRFAIVVLARAREATGALQRFAVVRIFKGDAPQVVELEVDDQPADLGRLHLLMLDPTPGGGEQLVSPEPIPSLAATRGDAGLGHAAGRVVHLRRRAHPGARVRRRHRPGHGQPAAPLTGRSHDSLYDAAMNVRSRYFSDAKPAFLQLIDPRGLRVLDLGCGGGHNGAMLKKAGAREVVGLERDPGAAQDARKRLDRVVECDLAKLDPADLGDELFDAILASDVLEHLYDAEDVLARAVTRLRPGGAVVLSLPNISNVYVFSQLLLKTWPRRDSGIFDRTHVRFFARRDMVRLLQGAGLRVLRVEPYFTRYRAIRAAALVLSLYVFRDYWARQFLLLAVKPD